MTDEKKPRMPMHEGLPLQHLMERFPDLHKAEFEAIVASPPHEPLAEVLAPTKPAEKILVTGLTAQCPRPHIGGLTGIVHFIEDEENGRWTTHGCDMGCPAAKVFEESHVMDARVPGEDDGEPQKKEKPTPSKRLLRDHVLPLSREMLRKEPGRRRYMLKDSRTGVGTYLQGTAGLFAAAGGSGKSFVLNQLAICCATGLTWFGDGGWTPVEILRVLLLAAEEDEEELRRRLYYAARASGASSDELLDLVAKNVDAIPLHGRGVALTADENYQQATGGLPETAFAGALRELLTVAKKQGRPYGLVIIDPFSRFAGFDAEKDNASATRWVQVVETLSTEDTGRPSVIVAHHTKKRAHNDKADANAELIRGASALKDGVRWAAVLEQQKRGQDQADLLTLRIVKANGVPPQLVPVVLCRDQKHEGALRLATNAESDSNEKVASILKSKVQQIDSHKERVLAVVHPGRIYSRNDIFQSCGGKRGLILEAVRQLLNDGVFFEPRRGTIQLVVPGGTQTGYQSETIGGNGAQQPGTPTGTLPPKEEGTEGTSSAKGQQQPLDLQPGGTQENRDRYPVGTSSGTTSKDGGPDGPG